MTKGNINCLPTGVPELDEVPGGSLPRGYSLLVAGPTSPGKNVLASACLVEGARSGETGFFALFKQPARRSRGPVIADLIDSGHIGMLDTRQSDLSS